MIEKKADNSVSLVFSRKGLDVMIASIVDQANFLPDCSTSEGYEKSKRIGLDGRRLRKKVDDLRKELGKDARDYIAKVNSVGNDYINQIDKAINPHIDARKRIDDAEKIKSDQEKEKASNIIKEIHDCIYDAALASSEGVQELIEKLDGINHYDYGDHALEVGKVRLKILEQLKKIKAEKIFSEASRKKLENIESKKHQETSNDCEKIIYDHKDLEKIKFLDRKNYAKKIKRKEFCKSLEDIFNCEEMGEGTYEIQLRKIKIDSC